MCMASYQLIWYQIIGVFKPKNKNVNHEHLRYISKNYMVKSFERYIDLKDIRVYVALIYVLLK